MANGCWLRVELDWWDDGSVAVFEPMKVLRRLRTAFPGVEINPADGQRERFEWELAFWSRPGSNPETRSTLVRSSWDLYATVGPTYTFVVPLTSDVRVAGSASRLAVTFKVPAAVPEAGVESLVAFLRSLGMGEPIRREPMPVNVPPTSYHRPYPTIDAEVGEQ